MNKFGPIPPWYVLTGGPCAGKSTLLKELAKLGYAVVPEPGRVVCSEALARGKLLHEIRNPRSEYFKAIYKKEFETIERANSDVITFFDRTFIDSIGYIRLYGEQYSQMHHDAASKYRFGKVFLLDPLPYEEDEVRNESPEEAARVHSAVEQAYREYGYELIPVAVMPISERLEFVLQYLEK